jgi:hypothetical protein
LSTRAARALACALALAFGVGCSATAGGLRLPEGFASIGVALFHNDSREPDLEREFHATLSATIRDLVSAPLESPGRADLVLDGRLESYERRGGVRARDNALLESAVVIRIDARLVQRADGEVLAETSVVERIGYAVGESSGERGARQRALLRAGEDIVLDLLAETN